MQQHFVESIIMNPFPDANTERYREATGLDARVRQLVRSAAAPKPWPVWLQNTGSPTGPPSVFIE